MNVAPSASLGACTRRGARQRGSALLVSGRLKGRRGRLPLLPGRVAKHDHVVAGPPVHAGLGGLFEGVRSTARHGLNLLVVTPPAVPAVRGHLIPVAHDSPMPRPGGRQGTRPRQRGGSAPATRPPSSAAGRRAQVVDPAGRATRVLGSLLDVQPLPRPRPLLELRNDELRHPQGRLRPRERRSAPGRSETFLGTRPPCHPGRELRLRASRRPRCRLCELPSVLQPERHALPRRQPRWRLAAQVGLTLPVPEPNVEPTARFRQRANTDTDYAPSANHDLARNHIRPLNPTSHYEPPLSPHEASK